MTKHTPEEIDGKIAELFTIAERKIISDLIKNGHYVDVAAAVDINTQNHEYWLNQLLELYRPAPEIVDSVVEEEMRIMEGKHFEIDSPAKEKFWMDRLELEKQKQPLPPLEEALKVFEDSLLKKEETPVTQTETSPVIEPVGEVPIEIGSPRRGRPKKIDATVPEVAAVSEVATEIVPESKPEINNS